jgi:hypothetical protein
MINRVVAFAAAAVAMGATSAAAETVFAGTVRTTDVTPACQFYGVGRIDNSQFHPKIPGNAGFSAISFLQPHSAVGYKLENRNFDEFFRTVVSGGVGWGDPFEWTGSRVRVTVQIPEHITPSTPAVFLRGQIIKPEDDPGGTACIIDFDASYVLRPF